ncbi:MAG: hypothetical protein A2Y33_04895 [Spirochaetes bacterium GWF1_51_8]|nr:MAG: hypothetical protein A2Y33_04895 [Spirochaetes bacterium GWF1_51_8]
MTIRQAEPRDFPRLLELSYLFDFSPFNIDKKYRSLSENFYPSFADDMIKKKTSVNIAAEEDGKIVGFVTIGLNDTLSRAVGKKIGNIYLLAVDPVYRSKGIGRFLVEKGCGVLYTYGADVITVGTDVYNLPALHVYESTGFKTAMFWHIYRYFPGAERRQDEISEDIDLISRKNLEQYLPHIERPVSLLKDTRIPQDLLTGYIAEQFIKKSFDDENVILEYRDNGLSKGMIHLSADKLSMATLDVKKPIYKISDLIVFPEYAGKGIEIKLLKDIEARMGEYILMEMWAEPGQRDLICALEECGFHLSYSGVSLHRWKNKSI